MLHRAVTGPTRQAGLLASALAAAAVAVAGAAAMDNVAPGKTADAAPSNGSVAAAERGAAAATAEAAQAAEVTGVDTGACQLPGEALQQGGASEQRHRYSCIASPAEVSTLDHASPSRNNPELD